MTDEGAAHKLGPLPGGHHGLSRAQVAESQRERLLAAIAKLVAERGYNSTTITEIARTASVSSRVFYENFSGKEECFLAAFDAVVDHAQSLVTEAVGTAPDWPRKVVAALRVTVDFCVEEPELARAFLIEPATASPAIVSRRREAIVAAIPLLEHGRLERKEAADLPDSTEDSVIGGLVTLLSGSLPSARPPDDVLADMVRFALTPYLGDAEARRLASEASTQNAP